MNKLFEVFKSVACKTRAAKNTVCDRTLKICAGWQALTNHGYSKTYRAGKIACITGIFLASALGLNVEGMIGSGLGLTDELAFLAKMGDDSLPPEHDIS